MNFESAQRQARMLHSQMQSNGMLSALNSQGKLASLIQLSSLATTLHGHAQTWLAEYRENHTYSISITNTDQMYIPIHRWLMTQLPDPDRKSLEGVSVRKMNNPYHPMYPMYNPSDQNITMMYQYDGRRDVKLTINGHSIAISIEKDDLDQTTGLMRNKKEARIIFSAKSIEGQQAVMDMLARLAVEESKGSNPRVYSTASWNDWQVTGRMVLRDPSTVILKRGQYERISTDLRQFLDSEDLYSRIGIPWHRGYLLHGPPGTGKTSTVMALAHEHKMDVYYLPLGDVKSDADLANLFSEISERSILLIEDIDGSKAATTRDEEHDKVSAMGLFNALDGVITPHGLVTVMTTNYPERLDEALIRTGRCDMTEEISYLDHDQLERLVAMMTQIDGPIPRTTRENLVASEIAEVIKRKIRDMPAAREDVIAFLKGQQDG